MSMSKRKDGRWVVKYKDSVTGKWRQRAFRDRREAFEFEDDALYDRRENERLTLGDAVAAFIANVPHVHRTVQCYSFLVNGSERRKINPGHTEGPAEFLANKYCSELTRRDLENLRLRLRERGQCAHTINLCVGRLKAAMNWCVENDLLASNPWKKYRALSEGPRRTRAASLEDFMLVYSLLPPWLQWACRTAMALCLRPGLTELFSLEWKAFDWRARCVEVAMSKVGRRKTVYIPDWYYDEAIERCRADREAGRELVCRTDRERRVISSSSYANWWRKACRETGVRIAFYSIRHIAASEMLAGGADLAAVSAQLGHSNVAVTASFYTHVISNAQRRASRGIPELPMVQTAKNDADVDLVRNGAGIGRRKPVKTRG